MAHKRNNQGGLFGQRPQPPARDGATFVPKHDGLRLAAQHTKVLDAMSDGEWHTLGELELSTGYPQASISARLRDFRKKRFGSMDIQRRRVGDVGGLFEYRLGG